MRQIIIYGLEQFADTLFNLLQEDNEREVVAFSVDEAYMPDNTKKNGLPIVPYEKLEEYYSPSEYSILFCMGNTRMNLVRKERMLSAKDRGYFIESYVHPTALIQTEDIGFGNVFMENSLIGPKVKIGNGNIFWPASHVAHNTTVGNYNFFTISVAVAGNVIIGDNCVFGANCTVKDHVEIADGTLVGAGAYISKSTEPWSVYAPPRTYKLEGKSSLDFKLG